MMREFERTGWTRLPSFVSLEELEQLRDQIPAARARAGMACIDRPGNELVALPWDSAIVRAMLASRMRRARLVTALEAPDLKWISGYLSIKGPRTPPLYWHQDWWCWDHDVSYADAAPQIAVLVYLEAAYADNGALRLMTGSHRRRVAMHDVLPDPHGTEADVLAPDHPALCDAPEQTTIEVAAGDAVVLDYRLLHGTHANASLQFRNAILLSFCPNWSGLPQDIRGHLISHPALPPEGVLARPMPFADLLPGFGGERCDLPINRLPPPSFGREPRAPLNGGSLSSRLASAQRIP